MNNKNKSNNNTQQPKPFQNGFGVQPTHDKPSPNTGGENKPNDNKKQQGK